jgi:hypothetical protein
MTGTAQPSVPLTAWALPLRGIAFTGVVLVHALRRLLPPY